MTTVKDLETNAERLRKELDSLNKNIEELKLKEQKEKENSFWEPEENETVWVNSGYFPSAIRFNKAMYQHLVDGGRVFKTQEEANKARKVLFLTQELRKMANGYKFKNGEKNYFIRKYYRYFNSAYIEVESHSVTNIAGTVYFPTAELAQAVIDTYGDRLNVLFD